MRRLSRQIDSQLTHELDEVAALQRTHIDPQTKRPFVDADHLLLAALEPAPEVTWPDDEAVDDGNVRIVEVQVTVTTSPFSNPLVVASWPAGAFVKFHAP